MVSDDNFDPVETHTKEYFGCLVTVWRIKGPYWGCCPWRFSVEHEGVTRSYAGVSNYVETKAKALKRAWYRAKWLADGSYHDRYH